MKKTSLFNDKRMLLHALWLCSLLVTCHHLAADCESAAQLLELGNQACTQNNFEQALCHLQKARLLEPTHPDVLFKLGYVHLYLGHIHESLEAYLSLIRTNPAYRSTALHNIGYILKVTGRMNEAVEVFKKVIAAHPDYESAHLGLSFALITKGRFGEGFQSHEWNLIRQGKNAPELRALLATGNLAGKTIVLLPEGGLGDTINFFPCAKILKERGACIIGLVQRPLYEILKNCDYYDLILPTGAAVPANYDARVTYMSLPSILGYSESFLPRQIPYITPNKELVEKWGAYLKNQSCGFKVGICWQADVYNDSSRLPMARRGMPLELLAQLSKLPNVSLFSLQKKDGASDVLTLSSDFKIHVFDDSFDEANGPFVDTAAVMANLDLIIAIDSAVAHLAGAMGKEVWLLLPYSADWRWLAEQSTSPWYPTMKIFKQPKPFDWESVASKVCFELGISSQVIKY